MTTCQTAANEFLRQFWLAIYPPPSELQTASNVSAAQKSAKAAKMIGYLGRTHEKVEALVVTAKKEGVDANRVQVVSPTFWNNFFALFFYTHVCMTGHETHTRCRR